MQIRTGCVGYSYDFWVGPFYPKRAKPDEHLTVYSKVFDLVEIDSTFYRIPAAETVRAWRDAVPDGFTFTVKFPQAVTHERLLRDVDATVSYFLSVVSGLGDKVGPLVLQLPPSLHFDGGYAPLKTLLEDLPERHRYVVEFRHNSWFRDETYALLRERNAALCWSEVASADTPAVPTADFLYVRFIGDRSLDRLGWIQIDREKEVKTWVDRIRAVESEVPLAYVLSNNHFAGLGPATIDLFRHLAGLPPVDLSSVHEPEPGQTRLGDF